MSSDLDGLDVGLYPPEIDMERVPVKKKDNR